MTVVALGLTTFVGVRVRMLLMTRVTVRTGVAASAVNSVLVDNNTKRATSSAVISTRNCFIFGCIPHLSQG